MTTDGPEGVGTPSGQPVVAITGASGYLGSVLVAAFGSAGYRVRRLLRSPASDSSDHFFDLNSVALVSMPSTVSTCSSTVPTT